MSCDVDLLFLIKQHLVDKQVDNNRDYSYFHASEWDRCHRKIAYSYYESKGIFSIPSSCVVVDDRIQRVFDNGHSMHDRWKIYFESTGALCGVWKCIACGQEYGKDKKTGVLRPEVCSSCQGKKFSYEEVGFYDDETWWGGHVDAIMDLGVITDRYKGMKKQEGYLIVDFKSMKDSEFQKLVQPKPEHLTQMQIYLYLSGLQCGKFLYENKNDQNVKEFLVERDDAYIEIKRHEAKLLRYQLEHLNSRGQHVLPPRAFSAKTAWECKSCKYFGKCWGA